MNSLEQLKSYRAVFASALGATHSHVTTIDAALATGDEAYADATVAWVERQGLAPAKALATVRRSLLARDADLKPRLWWSVRAEPRPHGSGLRRPNMYNHEPIVSLGYRIEPTRDVTVLIPHQDEGTGNISQAHGLAAYFEQHTPQTSREFVAAAVKSLETGAVTEVVVR